MTTQIVRNTQGAIEVGKFCTFFGKKTPSTLSPKQLIEGIIFYTTIQGFDSNTKIEVYFDGVKDSEYSLFKSDWKREASKLFKNSITKKSILSKFNTDGYGILNFYLGDETQPRVDYKLIGNGEMIAMDMESYAPIQGEHAHGSQLSYKFTEAFHEVGDRSPDNYETTFQPQTVNMTIGFKSLGEIDFVKTYNSVFTIWDLYNDIRNATNSGFNGDYVALTTDVSDSYFYDISDNLTFKGKKVILSGNDNNHNNIYFAKSETGEHDVFYIRYPEAELAGEFVGDAIFHMDLFFGETRGVF